MSRPEPDEERLGRLADTGAAGEPPAASPQDAEGQAVARASRALSEAWRLGEEELSSLVDALAQAPHAPPPPALPEDYEVLGEIGHGGTGVVYRARQRSLDRDVAVKVLRTGDLLFGSALKRFEREARALARLRHPHIVAVHDVGSAEGRLWYSMDLVEGRSLADRLKEGPLAAPLAARLVAEVAGAVAYVHRHGLVHRDLKPGNILLDREGSPFVTDFGLALEIGNDAGLTLTGQIVGTPAYMSPEQALGDMASIGAATDVYAMGAVLYECLTGRRPFQGLSPAEQVYAVIHREPPAPRRIDARIPEALERVCLQAMRKRPGERYASAQALEEDLRRFLAGQPVSAEAVSAPRRLARFVRGHAAAVGWGVAACLAVALALAPWASDRDARRQGADHLRHVARLALDRGDGAEAEEGYRRANLLEGRAFPADAEDAQRLAESRIATGKRLWESGKPEDAVALLDRTIAECAPWAAPRGRDDQRRPFEADLPWARGTALAVAGKPKEAAVAYHEAMDRAPRSFGSSGWREAYVAARMRDMAGALLDERDPGRAAAIATATMIVQWRIDPDLAVAANLVQEDARHLRWLLPAAVDPPPTIAQHTTGHFLAWIQRVPTNALPRTAERVLAELANDPQRPLRTRRAAAALLGQLADVPTPEVFAVDTDAALDLPWDPMEVPTLWASWARAGRPAAHAERLHRALATWRASVLAAATPALEWTPLRSAGQGIPGYLRDRTGMPRPAGPDEAEAWLRNHDSEDPWRPLAASLGFDVSGSPPSAEEVLQAWPRLDESDQRRAHFLLTWLVPAQDAVPRAGVLDRGSTGLLAGWRAVVSGTDAKRVARVAVARFDPTSGWSATPSQLLFQPLDTESGPLLVSSERRPPARELAFARLSPPGLGPVGATSGRGEFQTSIGLGWGDLGLEARMGSLVRSGPGWSSTSGGDRSAPGDLAFSLEFTSLGFSTPDVGRNELHLVALEPPGASAAPWTLGQWRERIANDVSRVADLAEREAAALARTRWPPLPRTIIDYQQWLFNVGLLAMRLPIPEARDGLRRLDERMATDPSFGWEWQRATLLRARLRAGDAALLSDAGVIERLRKEKGGAPDHVERREAQMWALVLGEGTPGPLRELAVRRLSELEIPADSAADLLDAERAGRTTIPAAVRARIPAGKAVDRTILGHAMALLPWASAFAALVALAGLLALALAVLPRGGSWTRLVPAAWLVLFGVVAECFDVVLAGADVLPDAAGLAAAALGSFLLARSVGGRLRWLPSILFAAGAVVAATTGDDVPALHGVRTLAVWAAVAVLPLLAARLRGPAAEGASRSAWPWPFALFYVAPLAVASAWTLAAPIVPGASVTWQVSRDLGSMILLVLGICALWALATTIRAAAVRAAWMRSRSRA